MSAFTSPLKVSPLPNGRWVVLEEFSYWTELFGECWTITVPAGFVTDFASIPRAVWWLMSPYDPTHGKAAVIHDYLYASQPCSRKEADQVFLEAMQVLGCGWCRRTVIYQSVRWFAGGAWKAHAERNEVRITVEDIMKLKRGQTVAERAEEKRGGKEPPFGWPRPGGV